MRVVYTEWWLNWLAWDKYSLQIRSSQCKNAPQYAVLETDMQAHAWSLTTETLKQLTWPDLLGETPIYRNCKLNIPHQITSSQTDNCRRNRRQMWTNSTTLPYTQHTKRCPSRVGMLRWVSWSSNDTTRRFLIHANTGYLNTGSKHKLQVKHWQ